MSDIALSVNGGEYMAYTELVKSFNRVREYLREFYVYGFKSREEYTNKSARSYDDERRRLESWLGNHLQFRQNADGKIVFLSIDSRESTHNPLYKAWKTKSFTDGDITLHFILFDILSEPSIQLTIGEITEKIDTYVAGFSNPKTFDESTVRKKLKEYVEEGIIKAEKRGKTVFYRRAEGNPEIENGAISFFSEVAPCGVVGAFLLDKDRKQENFIRFKHHYITGAMDSEVMYAVLSAMAEKRAVVMKILKRQKETVVEDRVVPLKIMVSVQNGRQYVMAYSFRIHGIMPIRLDSIVSIKMDEVSEAYDKLQAELKEKLSHIWGVSVMNTSGKKREHVSFTIRYGEQEQHIPGRLEREKRIGTVVHHGDFTSTFSADVYDATELVPWIRTFVGRIIRFSSSNHALEALFWNDIDKMNALYGIDGRDADAVQ